jgi:manganese transport protein
MPHPSHSSAARRRGLRALGPAFVAAIAYIDPGNYATNIQAGAQYGYLLLWVVLWANLIGVFVQFLSSKLGIATGASLASLIRDRLPRWGSLLYWAQAEILAMATDLAEFIGAALGFKLLFGVSLLAGAVGAGVVTCAILLIEHRGIKPLEAVIAGMLAAVALIYLAEMAMSRPDAESLLTGLLLPRFPSLEGVFLSAGILGATVMPHVIYLHSALSGIDANQSAQPAAKALLRFSGWDIALAMTLAGFVNIALLAMAAATLHGIPGELGTIEQAYRTLQPLLGPFALHIFGLSLIIAGVSSSVVGTLAGQEVMQDFTLWRIPLWLRRAVTMAPSFIVIALGMDVTEVLIVSQVVLSFGIGLALVPLLLLTGNQATMGPLVNHRATAALGWLCVALIVVLNLAVLTQTFAAPN